MLRHLVLTVRPEPEASEHIGLTSKPRKYTFTISSVTGTQITVTGTPVPLLVVGANFTNSASNPFTIASLGTGTGGAGTYNVVSGYARQRGHATAQGSLFSSGTPGTIYASERFYNSPFTPSASTSGIHCDIECSDPAIS